MNKTLKKLLSVVLTMAMIVTSITVYNTTAKAEEEETPNIEVTASVENNMINAKWSQPDVEFASLAYYINYADQIQLDEAHWARAANGWCWTQAMPTEKRTALDTVAKSNDNSIDVSNGGTYVLTVQYLDAEGNVVASGTSNAVTTEKVVNTNLNLKVERYETGIAYLKWSLISGAAKYEVYNADTNELMKTSDSSTTDWTNVTIKQGVTYNLVVKAIDANGEEIAITNNITTAYQEPETTTEPTEPDKAPEEHTKADFSNATWAELSTKAGLVDNRYFINSDHTLSQAVWYGIYAPHSAAAYHNERTACILSDDAASFTFQQRDVTSVWINGTEYANPSTALNCQGDCTEVSTEFLNKGINVVTIVMSDGKTNTFGIKVEEPLAVDATAPATQDTIDPATVAEWTQMAGTTANGSKVFKDATVTTSTNGGLDGCYAAGAAHPEWNNITDIMNAKTVFGVVRGGTNSVIIDGVEYINAKDARSTKVYIGNDCIYVDAALLDAPVGETQYHMITLTGGTALTFILKVEGPEATYKVTLDGENVATDVVKYTFGNNEQGYYDKTNDTAYAPNTTIELNKDIDLTTINLDVKMLKGASIRLSAPTGLRFQTNITSGNNDLSVLESAKVTTGTIITTTEILGDANIDKNFVKDDTKTKLDIVNSGWYEGKTGNFCGAIVKIDKSNYDTEFVGVGYVTIKYNDNTEKTIFASVNEKGDNIRSASTVAKSVQQSEKYQNNYTKEQKEIVDAYAKGNSAN
ncbi:hypothetical protein [uncultured Eubacterium sp.]|uniref:hypothetical protein n=1 Tax=uncultured Eubacterium sp. TaxID=165185 RepID=UPI003263D905